VEHQASASGDQDTSRVFFRDIKKGVPFLNKKRIFIALLLISGYNSTLVSYEILSLSEVLGFILK